MGYQQITARRQLIFLSLLLATGSCATNRPPSVQSVKSEPASASATFNILDYGAVADGRTLCSDAFQKAITACETAGGGRVIVPTGTFLTGPIELRSGVDLHLNSGATILFSRDYSLYPMVVVNWEGKQTVDCRSPVWGDNLHDVSITGNGVIDGQGDAWRSTKKSKLSEQQWNDLVKSGGVVDARGETWYPSNTVMTGAGGLARIRAAGSVKIEDYANYRELLRPVLVLLSDCRNVRLEGVTFRNSPCWNIHLFSCENVLVTHATMFNEIYAQNGDGIDVDCCRNVTISDCKIDAGDDDICLKSGRDEKGRKRGQPTENITINNCVIGWGHGGVTIGSEMSGGVRNVSVTNCIMKGTDAGLRFKTTRGRGGTVENIRVDNVEMSGITGAAILFDMYYMERQPHAEPVSERTPIFRQFEIHNVICRGAKTALTMRGLEELPLEGITLEHVDLSADSGGTISNAKNITLRDVRIEARKGPALVAEQNVKDLVTDRLVKVESEMAQ